MTTRTVSQFLENYRGVEGFYFINRNADLGYIRAADAKPVKETFPQLHDRQFVRKHRNFVHQLESFLRDLLELSHIYLNTAETRMELGHILPANSNKQEWQSATLVVNNKVIESTQKDYDEIHRHRLTGTSDPVPALTEIRNKLNNEHSAYRGLQLLIDHKNSGGEYQYFPVLFFHSGATSNEARAKQANLTEISAKNASMRIINLLWQRTKNESVLSASYSVIFDVLRHNLKIRRVIDRDILDSFKTDTVDQVVAPNLPEARPH